MYVFSVIREVVIRVRMYAVFGGIFFPTWFLWNIKEVEFLFVSGYIMHFVGGAGAGLLAATMVIGAGDLKAVPTRFYWIVFPSVFLWLTGMEWVQRSQPWRTFQWEDIWTQTAGLAVALGIVWWNEKHISSPVLAAAE